MPMAVPYSPLWWFWLGVFVLCAGYWLWRVLCFVARFRVWLEGRTDAA